MPQDIGSPSQSPANGMGPSAANNPGMRTTRPAPAAAMQKLTMLMFQGFKLLGEEGLKGPNADPAQMARAQAMIQQAQAAAKGIAGTGQPSSPQGTMSNYGRRSPIDQPVDPMSRMAPGTARP